MAILYVARSTALAKWASDVGLGKHVVKVGLAADKDAVKLAIETGWAGESDWRLLASDDAGDRDETAVYTAIAGKEKAISPDYYPRIKGAPGVFSVKIAHVQNAMLVSQAMNSADEPLSTPKPKDKDVAAYLLRLARS